MLSRLLVSTLMLSAIILLGGCARQTEPRRLTVFAAASLSDAFQEAAEQFQAVHLDVVVSSSFAGSQRLFAQISLGATADLYASASPKEMAAAAEQRLLAGEPAVLARNKLAILVPAANPAAIVTPLDLARPGLRLALADAAVPIGEYSRATLAKLASVPGAPPDFVARALRNVRTEDDDVKQVVAKVRLGEVDAGIAYLTDGRTPGVKTIAIPDEFNVEATYLAAKLLQSKERGLATIFLDFLLSKAGQEILRKHGFEPRDSPSSGSVS